MLQNKYGSRVFAEKPRGHPTRTWVAQKSLMLKRILILLEIDRFLHADRRTEDCHP